MFISQRTGERSMILDLLYLMRQKTSQTKIGFKKRTQSPGHSFQNVTQTSHLLEIIFQRRVASRLCCFGGLKILLMFHSFKLKQTNISKSYSGHICRAGGGIKTWRQKYLHRKYFCLLLSRRSHPFPWSKCIKCSNSYCTMLLLNNILMVLCCRHPFPTTLLSCNFWLEGINRVVFYT